MIRTDSRKVQEGDTFVALPGFSSNGDQYIDDAIRAGASVIVCRKQVGGQDHSGSHDHGCGKDPLKDPSNGKKNDPGLSQVGSGKTGVSFLYTDDPRGYLEQLLVREYGGVISQMTLIALTGTNGKTTTCYLIAQALNRLGRKCAYIGTIGYFLGEKVRNLPNTSVDICDLYELLLEAHEAGYDTVALEASSQGIAWGRLNTLTFDIAAFTNLTEDHLDYHKTMHKYALAKQQIFRRIKPGGTALVNADDPYRDYFILAENDTVTYGLDAGDCRAVDYQFQNGTVLHYLCPNHARDRISDHVPEGPGAREQVDALDRSLQPSKRDICSPGHVFEAHTALIGRYNVYNTMAVIGVLHILGYTPQEISRALEGLHAPDGRCDTILYQGAHIVIDYAHTPDAVEKIMETAREFTTGRMYVVFGCTGDREREKRPVMTQLVLSGCEYAIITDDDVHSEPEQQIVDDMLQGNTRTNYEVCLDRKEAIRRGISLLKADDSLLILGKGHEEFIIMDGYKIPHNDRKAVLELTGQKS